LIFETFLTKKVNETKSLTKKQKLFFSKLFLNIEEESFDIFLKGLKNKKKKEFYKSSALIRKQDANKPKGYKLK
jgi:hypothetical protein